MKTPDASFWKKLQSARTAILALDYDGTLAPFRVERMQAGPYPGIPELLASIMGRGDTRVALVSGRTVSELDQLIGPLGKRMAMIGSHGWELRTPGEAIITSAPPPPLGEALARAYHAALESGRSLLAGPDEALARVEKKPASVAAHLRGLDQEVAGMWLERLRNEWRDPASRGLELLEFNGGLEIRAPGKDKGSAVIELIRLFPEAGIITYLGDDVTDEDAFKALPENGVGILVSENPGSTRAGYYLTDCRAVRDFLASWDQVRGAGREDLP